MLRNWKKRTLILSRPFSRFQLEKSIIIKNIFIIKSLTDFRKTVETGVDPHLSVVLSSNPQPCL